MGRPSKLTDKQWAEIGRRLAKGDRPTDLAREFGVSKQRISGRFSVRTETLKTVAQQVADAETAFAALPVLEQITVRSLADDLRAISGHLVTAARNGAMTSSRLSHIAHVQTDKLDESAGLDENAAVLQSVIAFTKGANLSAETGLNLLAANKDMLREGDNAGPRKLVLVNDPDAV